LAAIEKGDPGDAAQIEGVGMIVCPSGPLCHATVAFLLNTEEPFMLPHPMELMRPDSGALFEGQIPDVVTPPPLSMRA
ncbi:MAG: hypothetical protein OXQ30_05025, partial [Boseongicola sp.]|nr:hypothetical protein [Boseongicola sp.]